MVNAKSDWMFKHLTFDPENYFCIFFAILALTVDCTDLPTLFFFMWRYILKMSRSQSSFKVMDKGKG